MLSRFIPLALAVPLLLGAAAPARNIPTRIGACAMTRVDSVHQRLDDGSSPQGLAGSGSAVDLANGVYGVSYDQVPAVNRSRRGDPVRVCLVSIPRHCPRGDDRGRAYRTTNLRTHQSWTLPDSQHMCGGA